MKKKVIYILIIINIFIPSFYISAYDFQNPQNSSAINDMITEIYDAKNQYEDLVGDYNYSSINIIEASSNNYWWPIGSIETTSQGKKNYAKGDPETTIITSLFGYRSDPFGTEKTVFHSGLDISGGRGLGAVNIIAAKDGVVVYPTSSLNISCPSASSQSNCGGGYGNYVVIQHSDGNYTLYAHMEANTITVKEGDSVTQGQVIGKMGSSGFSTGAHLHFEIREGQNTYEAAVDPLNYISDENPRTGFSSNEFLEWLNRWEGYTTLEGDSYKVVNIGDGVRTVGSGVTLEYNASKFLEYGININDYPEGSKIKKSIVDQIEQEIINEKKNYVESILSENSITLEEKQILALVSQMYNCGNISGFSDAYKRYGNTQNFYDNWFFRNVMKGTQFEAGLTKRRNSEWSLFNKGVYTYNE